MARPRKRHALDEIEVVDACDVHGKRRVLAPAQWPQLLRVSTFEPGLKLGSVFVECLVAD
ncbi:hypothetical protein GCM10008012_13790 [Rhizobium anhuiense]|nr:hypothetical protein GCM10008012_13790 [Rhizobium anhuiense]